MRAGLLGSSSAVAILVTLAAVPGTAGAAAGQQPSLWRDGTPFRELVVSSPTRGGGYPGAKPAPGGCRNGRYNSNFSEGALALRPGSEQLAGGSKAFFGRWSTYKASHTVSFSSMAKRPRTHFIGGYDCATTGSQAMPPSWTNVTDPNLAWDRRGRVHQLVLAYNAYWGSVEQPNGNVYSVYSDDGGRTWRRGNAGRPVEEGPDPSVDATTYLDKPWIAANQNPRDPRSGHV